MISKRVKSHRTEFVSEQMELARNEERKSKEELVSFKQKHDRKQIMMKYVNI